MTYNRPNRIVGSGDFQEATPHRQALAQEELDRLYEYHVAAQTHLWLVVLTHRATDAILDGYEDPADVPILDVDSLIGQPVVACYVCEVAYEPRLRRRRCPGDPTPGGKA